MVFIRKILVCFLLCLSLVGKAQINAKNSVFIEALGSSASLSVNYDRIFINGKWIKLTANAGVGYLPVFWEGRSGSGWADYGASASINTLVGKKNHYFEIGLGITYNVGGINAVMINGVIHESEGLFFVPRIGYRYQRDNGGFFFRCGFTPLILLKDYSRIDLIPHYGRGGYGIPVFNIMGGLSLGYSF